MATSNKAISAYLPPDIEEYLTKYCTEYNITRKDKSGENKPALGTAIVEILKVFFSSERIPSPLPDNVPVIPGNVVTEDKLQEVISTLRNPLPDNVPTKDDLNNVLGKVPEIVDELLTGAIANLTDNEQFLEAIASKLPA